MRSTCLIIGSALLLLVAAPVACGGSSSGSSGSTSGESTTGSGGSGGGGGSKCATAADCPDNTPCSAPTCDNQVCGKKILLKDMPLPAQAYGDCKMVKCDASGSRIIANDDADVYDDGNPCTTDACSGGMPTNKPSAMAMCGDMTAPGVCNASGACVECADDTQCAAKVGKTKCSMTGKCVPDACLDMMKNGRETGTDCGGGDCDACADMAPCKLNSDCLSSYCKGIGTSKTCQAPACDDGQKNGDETDVDCGGKTCVALMGLCIPGQHCKAASDCDAHVCKAGACAAPSCTDNVKNGNETAVDCGGACPACPK
jgi:hypothetical protein